jgi:hypothetical protein
MFHEPINRYESYRLAAPDDIVGDFTLGLLEPSQSCEKLSLACVGGKT